MNLTDIVIEGGLTQASIAYISPSAACNHYQGRRQHRKQLSTALKQPSTALKQLSTPLKQPSTPLKQPSTPLKQPSTAPKQALPLSHCGLQVTNSQESISNLSEELRVSKESEGRIKQLLEGAGTDGAAAQQSLLDKIEELEGTGLRRLEELRKSQEREARVRRMIETKESELAESRTLTDSLQGEVLRLTDELEQCRANVVEAEAKMADMVEEAESIRIATEEKVSDLKANVEELMRDITLLQKTSLKLSEGVKRQVFDSFRQLWARFLQQS